MPFQIIRNDITRVKADAIVNTANPKPRYAAGTDRAIYTAAGAEQLLEQRRRIGDIAPGQAAYTDAFALQAKYIIHTVGPEWRGGESGERDLLRSCYEKSLALAAELKCSSIAFPLISSGVYGFPGDVALNIALSEIGKFLLTHEMEVFLVVLSRETLELSQTLTGDIEEYIDEHTADRLLRTEYGGKPDARRIRRERFQERASADSASFLYDEWDIQPSEVTNKEIPIMSPVPSEPRRKSLEELLNDTGETFQQRLLRLIDESGMDDVTVYKKANIDRKVFSRIRSKENYRPKKKTALAFAIALELDLPTTQDLLSRAEIAFSPSSRFDLIITYFIDHKIYDIFKINATLFRYGEQTLGE
ncbi:MAG: macro domain-containing protein [Clostridia bacterium]|nr:macro domain-containing protein [Clostridia bacterium]